MQRACQSRHTRRRPFLTNDLQNTTANDSSSCLPQRQRFDLLLVSAESPSETGTGSRENQPHRNAVTSATIRQYRTKVDP